MGEVAVIGLGGMGRAIARNLARAGHEVVVWNRSAGPAAELAEEGALRVANVAEALRCPVVFSVLADDTAFAEVFLDSGVLGAAEQGMVHVNMATVSVALARRAVAAHAAHGSGYVAAPVFGRVPVAEAGALNILAAGEPRFIDRVQPFFDVIGSRTWRLGEQPEKADVAKILGNYLIACTIQSLGESISVADAAGVDPSQFVELLSATLFPGPVYSGYGSMIAERKYQPAAFTTALGRKDLHLALEVATAEAIPLPFGELLSGVFDQAITAGHAADDWAAIAEQQPR
ncbi:NAD(P)-dependent oxidoreductase [Nocardia seriolae]|uniref:3-hydroxyisobutyrate dehydrogenase n=1 Tax=Nocardia seriolae TaxID=37332 RepID=A0A0B8NP52_9NOCA|nr:NAD(P)-dependent oxidoreductase [Nocardia seriolae]APA97861.1 3-hydroxyisobutyrate dehydrogenase [Nocardia seriolae]MTJ64389.1 NAD-binding protein [Nocardia seriolae]MTJ75359.1 NAD-binding protein [Nocardia seriolae]MTJ87617.1 NAD-binding protein [Nocardia seriolae]MTK31610.1 NAD-binding protein [Nocardia seriolae]